MRLGGSRAGSAAAGPRKRQRTRRAILSEPEAEDDPEASRMRRSEDSNSTATDGRRVRAVRTDSDRRDRGRQPRALREGRGRRTRFRLPRSPKRRKAQGRERSLWWRRASATDSGETANGPEPTEAKDVPRSEGEGRSKDSDPGRRKPSIPAGRVSVTKESTREPQGAALAPRGSRGRPESQPDEVERGF